MKTADIIIAHPGSDDKSEALKAFMKALKIEFEIPTRKYPYNPEFVAKIAKSRQDYKDGRGTVMTLDQLNSLWK